MQCTDPAMAGSESGVDVAAGETFAKLTLKAWHEIPE